MGCILKEGKLTLQVGGGELLAETQVNNNRGGMLRWYYRVPQNIWKDAVLYIDGNVETVSSSANPSIATGDSRDLIIGTNAAQNHFEGVVDEVRIYECGLTRNEIKSLFLDGTMVFTTSSVAQPPIVEVSGVVALPNASVSVIGELVRKDVSNPVVRIYYGLEDGGFDFSDWNNTLSKSIMAIR